jgi:F0F1-type ATP synthase membrane subunit c/vacuolar-type H+-ATPase subunit K
VKQRKKRWLALIVGVALLAAALGCAATQEASSSTASAQAAKTPEYFFHDIVDLEFVKQHIGTPMPEGVLLIDARPYKPKFVNGHIPLAVSIPDSQFEKMADNLPADKNSLLIFYCEGPS